MTTFKCEDIACAHCVGRIDKALTEAGIEHHVELDTKTVTIEDSENCAASAAEILDDLGFTPVELS